MTKDLIVYYCAGAVLGDIAESKGLRTASEIFADRAYMDDLSLVPRKMEGSMITDENVAIERCVKMIKEGKVTSINGKELDIKGDTLCVHGDGPRHLLLYRGSVRNSQKKVLRSNTYRKLNKVHSYER